jgi:hypothetical protein
MNNPRARQVRTDAPVESRPCHAAPLTAPVEPFEQEAASVVKVPLHAPEFATDTKVLDVALEMPDDILQHGFPPVAYARSCHLLQRIVSPRGRFVRRIVSASGSRAGSATSH